MRTIAPNKSAVEIKKNAITGRAHFNNLVICSRIWQCAVCAATITEKRRIELSTAIGQSGYYPALLTYTLRHNRGDSLVDLLAGLKAAYKVFKGGRPYTRFKGEYKWLGSVKSLEVTYGANGWHPHIHELALFPYPVTENIRHGLELFTKNRWRESVVKRGYDATWEHGANVTNNDHKITEYVAKFGHMPERAIWSIEHELVKAPAKRGRQGGDTPMQLLMNYGEGDTASGRRFVDYANAFKNSHQLIWSPGLRKLLGLGEDKTDEALADNETSLSLTLATLTRDQWRHVLRANCRAELLEVATNENEQRLFEYLAEITPDYTAGIPA